MIGPQTKLAKEVAESLGTVPDPNPSFVTLVLKDKQVVSFKFDMDHGLSGNDIASSFKAFVVQKYGTEDDAASLDIDTEAKDGDDGYDGYDRVSGVSAGDITLTEGNSATLGPEEAPAALPKDGGMPTEIQMSVARQEELTKML